MCRLTECPCYLEPWQVTWAWEALNCHTENSQPNPMSTGFGVGETSKSF